MWYAARTKYMVYSILSGSFHMKANVPDGSARALTFFTYCIQSTSYTYSVQIEHELLYPYNAHLQHRPCCGEYLP